MEIRVRWRVLSGCMIAVLASGCSGGGGTPGIGSSAPALATTSSSSPQAPQSSSTSDATVAVTAPTVGTTAASLGSASQSSCRGGDPLANVYHSYRLQVRSNCTTVTGTVAYIRSEDDGDIHVDLALTSSESSLLDQANYTYQDGQLVTEIVPADQPGCVPGQPPRQGEGSYDYGICTGADLQTPALGEVVRVTGPYVLDSDHGWMEIHPVWAITVIGGSSTNVVPGTAPVPTPTSTPSYSSTPLSIGAGYTQASCHASAAPSNDGYSGDYEVYVYSNQPDQKATASDSGDSWSEYTDGSGYADIRLYSTDPGEAISVSVGAATCSTTA